LSPSQSAIQATKESTRTFAALFVLLLLAVLPTREILQEIHGLSVFRYGDAVSGIVIGFDSVLQGSKAVFDLLAYHSQHRSRHMI
jgi:hypothetical protein